MRLFLLVVFAGGLGASPLTFSMSGTFNSSQPTYSPYFAPNEAWTLSFSVDSSPVIYNSFSSPTFSNFDAQYTAGAYTLGGSAVPTTGYQAYFDSGSSVFLDVCLDASCDNQIEFDGPPAFTGPVDDPTLSGGSFPSTDTVVSYYVVSQDQPIQHSNPGTTVDVSGDDPSSVPEPATFLAAGAGLLLLGCARRRLVRAR